MSAHPPSCNQEIFDGGTPIMSFHGPSPALIEAWVKRIAEETTTRTDWHFVGGHAHVLTLGGEGDCAKVRSAADRLWWDLIKDYRASGPGDWCTEMGIKQNLARRWL